MSVPGPANVALVATTIAGWFLANIAVLILNKSFLTSKFRFPFFLTLLHMLSGAVLSWAAARIGVSPPIRPMTSKRQAAKVFLLAVLFCFTIALSNMSLQYIPVSFNQAIGATTPLCTAVLAYLITQQVETRRTYAALIPVVLGIVIASKAEPALHVFGTACCFIATCGRAGKSVVQGVIMSSAEEKMDPMSLLLYMALFSVALLVPATMIMEPAAWGAMVAAMQAPGSTFGTWLLVNCFLAYAQNLLNFWVTKFTSALSLQVLGQAKGVLAAFASVLIFKNVVTAIGWGGYFVTIAGVFWYGEEKRRAKEVKAKSKAEQESSSAHTQKTSNDGQGDIEWAPSRSKHDLSYAVRMDDVKKPLLG